MYNASATFNTLIKSTERTFIYTGQIDTVNGNTYFFDGSQMRSGKITRSISDNKLEVGTVYSNEFDCELGLNISRYELYDATITLNIQIDGAADVIPMGYYTISEITQTSDRLKIKAYDDMVKFDSVDFVAADITNIQAPYDWLSQMCTACGVTLGMTAPEVRALPNGDRKTGFADVVTDVKTWRDVLGYLSAYLGSFTYIGRDGSLYIGQYSSTSVDTIPASFRYTSGLSDYRTTYDGLYAVHKESATQEYVSNTNTGGLVLDLGTNPFLQFTDAQNREDALQEIIDAWNGIYYVPYDADVPMNPLYDPGDVITFIDNQAGGYDLGAITEISLTIGGQMKVTCSGDNPRLADAQDRFTKSVEGLSSDYSNGQETGGKNFWMISTTNHSALTVTSTEMLLATIEYDQKTYGQKIEMLLTLDATLSATAEVNIRLVVDDDVDMQMEVTEDKSLIGERVFHCTNPQRVYGKGTHEAKVYMTVTDSPLLWSDLA